jgi:hypothetical protein
MTSAAKHWTKHYKHGMGSESRIVRNAYAYLVMVAVAGRPACPNCNRDFVAGDFDVDRVMGGERDAEGSEIYRAGTIVYLCKTCNQKRATLQAKGLDWDKVAEYQALVINASLGIDIPTLKEAKEWWKNRPTEITKKGRFE